MAVVASVDVERWWANLHGIWLDWFAICFRRVARQYSGTLGRIDSCQVGVFVGYTAGRLRVLIDRALYLPKAWTGDQARCAAAGVPDATVFATRSQLALTMIRRAIEIGLGRGVGDRR